MSWVFDEWFVRAVSAAVLVAVPASLLGTLLYFRRMSMLPDALAHAALPGVAVGYLLAGGPGPAALVGGAVSSGVVATGVIEVLQRRAHLRADMAVGVAYSLLFALGVLVVSTWGRGSHIDLDCVLFGNLLGVGNGGLATMAALAGLVAATIAATHRSLSLALFDPEVARAMGLPVARIHGLVLSGTAAVCAGAFEVTGSILVLAMFVLPAAAAHKLTTRFGATLLTSASLGVLMSVAGLLASVALDVSPAGAIACAGALVFVFVSWLASSGAAVYRRVCRGSTPPLCPPGSAAC